MDSELQAAFDRWDSRTRPEWTTSIVEAARKYANPDIEAATAIIYELRFAKTSDEWDDMIYDITKEAVGAALGKDTG